MNLKQSLHSLLADNETAEVIKQLREATEESSPKLFQEVEDIEMRFEANIEQSHNEFADELSTNKENARIRYQLLSVINRLPEDAELPSTVREKRLKIAGLIVLGVAIFGLIAFNFDWFKKDQAAKPIVEPVIEAPKTSTTPVQQAQTVAATPAVAPAVVPPAVLIDTLKKVDTLVKKKIRRIKKPPVVPAEPVLGVSQ